MPCRKPKCKEKAQKEEERRLQKEQLEKLKNQKDAANSATASDNNGTTK